MKKRFLVSLCLFILTGASLLISCNNDNEKKKTAQDEVSVNDNDLPNANEILEISSIDTINDAGFRKTTLTPSGTHVKVVIQSLVGYGQDESFAREAASLLEKILNSKEFRAKVENTSFNYHTNNHSAADIYGMIMKAHEINGPGGTDSVIDLRLRTISESEDGARWIRACNRSTIGIDGGGTGIAAVCPNWLHNTAVAGHYSWLAAHFIHEYMHILGFTHPDHKNGSVPYLIQNIVEDLGL